MGKSKYIPHWKQTQGKITKTEKGILIHPYDLISLVQRKKGLDPAGELAVKLLTRKYDQIFEEAKEN